MKRKDIQWILASGSPRRKELLKQIGLTFEVFVSDAGEEVTGELTPGELVEELSCRKAEAVAARLAALTPKGALPSGMESTHIQHGIIGADTIVYHGKEVLGKPKDEEDAFRMLGSLSGGTHSVFTGVTILLAKEKIVFHNETKVTFAKLSDEEIREYISSEEPMDKAGAYGIQGLGGAFVTAIEGEYANVVGFPIGAFCEELRKRGLY